MIKNENFIVLRTELSNAIFSLEKWIEGDQQSSMSHLEVEEFKLRLNKFFCDFVNEVLENLLTDLKKEKSYAIYLEGLLHMFKILDEQLGSQPNLGRSFQNLAEEDKLNSKRLFIHVQKESLLPLYSYFQHQKRVIIKTVAYLEKQLEKDKISEKQNGVLILSWKDELMEFYPEMIRLREGMRQFVELQDKMKYLEGQRHSLKKKFSEQNKDVYKSSINFFFEVNLNCLKDLCIEEQIKGKELNNSIEGFEKKNSKEISLKTIIPSLNWTASKVALVELIYGVACSGSINNGKIGIKKICELFELIFRIDLGDVYHIFIDIRNRLTDPTKFLDHMKNSVLAKIQESEKEYLKNIQKNK